MARSGTLLRMEGKQRRARGSPVLESLFRKPGESVDELSASESAEHPVQSAFGYSARCRLRKTTPHSRRKTNGKQDEQDRESKNNWLLGQQGF